MKPKSLVTVVLLVFVAISVVTLLVKELGGSSTLQDASEGKTDGVLAAEDRVIVYYFHGTSRCYTCRLIESYTRDVIESTYANDLVSGQIEFQVINVETSSTFHFIEDYQLYAPSVVLARFDNDVQAEWKNLDMVWQLVGDRASFETYVQNETAAMLQGGL